MQDPSSESPVRRWARACKHGIVLLAIVVFVAGCNLKAEEPGTLAADPNLQYATPMTPMPDLALGTGDQLDITIYRHDDLSRSVEIPASGVVFLPLAGDVDVRGTTAATVRERITAAYAEYIVDPQVSVEITVRRSHRVLVLGEVAQPGTIVLDRPTASLEAIAESGGFRRDAAQDAVYLHRFENGEPVQRVLNMKRYLTRGEAENNPMLLAGDILYVPNTDAAKVDRIAQHLSTWITPIILAEQAILNGQAIDNGFGGIGSGTNVSIPLPTTTP